MIVLEPKGGLCNRMRSIDSAISLGENLGKDVLILWSIDSTLHISFDKLFVRPKGINYLLQMKSASSVNRRIAHYVRNFIKYICDRVILENELVEMISQGYDFINLRSYRNIYIRTWERFINPPTFIQNFTPISSLLEKINTYGINENTVGIHIRRTDNQMSIRHSPTNIFIEKMHNEVKENNRVKFFVASDSIEEKLSLQKYFPERIITNLLARYDRSQPDAIQDAVIDLFCLSNCRKIIGSYWSSFTIVAIQLRDTPYEIVNPLVVD